VATRLDAMGRSSGHGRRSGERVLLAIVAPFGPGRFMLGSDLPIERLRGGFEHLYRAYDQIFDRHTPRDRELLPHASAEHWYGTGDPNPTPATAGPPRAAAGPRCRGE
jgi:predicted TIM-barrel fold metal-dependent hydrolase